MRAKRFMKGSKYGTATIVGGSDSVRVADLEPALSYASLQTQKGPRFNSPVCITVVSYRSRLCDADGISAKAAIDGLVHCGVLADDGPKYVAEVRYRQVKVKSKEEEETRLIIEVAE